MSQLTIRIVRPASHEKPDLLVDKLKEFEGLGISCLYEEQPPDPTNRFVASSAKDRSAELSKALLEKESDCVLCARGGYGTSDLLPLLPWTDIKKSPPKLLIGFSDISVIHAALYTLCGWPGLHAPMPGTTLWGKNGNFDDVNMMLGIIKSYAKEKKAEGSISVDGAHETINGWLFGGCFSTITNLIGTPYFPSSFDGALLFFEDVSENAGRILRFWNQWIQSGVLKGVKGIVLGNFIKCDDNGLDNDPFIHQEIAKRSNLPVFTSKDFGHISPNYPIAIGAKAHIKDGKLCWSLTNESPRIS